MIEKQTKVTEQYTNKQKYARYQHVPKYSSNKNVRN